MAKNNKNIVIDGLTGKVGNLVIRKRNGKTSVYVITNPSVPYTEKQKLAQQKFASAVKQAKEALKDAEQRKQFEILAKKTKNESIYSAAVSWFMKAEGN
jgi:hypothetical protein